MCKACISGEIIESELFVGERGGCNEAATERFSETLYFSQTVYSEQTTSTEHSLHFTHAWGDTAWANMEIDSEVQ